MKILVLEQRYTGPKEAGFARFSLLSRYWVKEGHEVYVVAGMINYILSRKPEKYRGKFFVKEKEGENVKILRVWESDVAYFSFLGRLCSYFSFLVSAFFGALFLPKPDVIIASAPPIFIGFLGYMISIAKRKPFIFEVRDIWPDEAIELRILKNKILIQMSYWLEEFLYQHSDFLVVNSPGIKEFLIKKKLVPETKIAVVPNPVDLDSFDAAPTKEIAKKNFGWPEDKFIFLYSGAMSAVYDLNSLLEVTKELQHLPILFILAGSGRQKRELMEKAEAEELKNVKFAEPVPKEKLPSLIMAADAGVATLSKMPLLRYVYATKIFDYMAAGRPVVLAMEGVSKELICEKAHCGLCVKPEDKTALKKAILQIYNNPEKGEEMGKRGFEYVRKHFRPEKLACDYLRLIKLLIQTSSRTRERG
jgi:glycosyltransferase involved in cell wall biosynthesis